MSNTLYEPFELLQIDVPQEYQGIVMQELGKRGANITDVSPNDTGTEIHFEAIIPTRTLLGLKSLLISETKGTAIVFSSFDSYKPIIEASLSSDHGSLISTETGTSSGYALENAQMRGVLFITPAIEVYQGMVIGQCSKNDDLEINPCKSKQLSNVRSKSSDEAIVLIPPRQMTLENYLEYIGEDELLEVTPLSLRVRKRYLDPNERKRRQR